MTNKRVVTLQDISCVGQCSITVALPIISACGVETIILPSAVLSTHTGGFSGFTFRDLTEDIPSIMKHWMKENQIFDCLYTGYLGSITQIQYVRDLRKNIIKSDGLLIVDPAMADHGKLYHGFTQDFVSEMAKLCGEADIILPNLTEAAFMTNTQLVMEGHDEAYIKELVLKLSNLGAKKVVLKGIGFKEGQIGVAVFDSESQNLDYYFTERVGSPAHGTGDCYAAAFTGALMQGKTEIEAASIAADFVVESIRHTVGDESHWYGVKFEKALPLLIKKLNL